MLKSACTANVYGKIIVIALLYFSLHHIITPNTYTYVARGQTPLPTTTYVHSPESLSITQRLSPPFPPPPTEESLELEEPSLESDELEESSDPAAAQNFDIVLIAFCLLPSIEVCSAGWTKKSHGRRSKDRLDQGASPSPPASIQPWVIVY